jgi:hypothetical protein
MDGIASISPVWQSVFTLPSVRRHLSTVSLKGAQRHGHGVDLLQLALSVSITRLTIDDASEEDLHAICASSSLRELTAQHESAVSLTPLFASPTLRANLTTFEGSLRAITRAAHPLRCFSRLEHLTIGLYPDAELHVQFDVVLVEAALLPAAALVHPLLHRTAFDSDGGIHHLLHQRMRIIDTSAARAVWSKRGERRGAHRGRMRAPRRHRRIRQTRRPPSHRSRVSDGRMRLLYRSHVCFSVSAPSLSADVNEARTDRRALRGRTLQGSAAHSMCSSRHSALCISCASHVNAYTASSHSYSSSSHIRLRTSRALLCARRVRRSIDEAAATHEEDTISIESNSRLHEAHMVRMHMSMNRLRREVRNVNVALHRDRVRQRGVTRRASASVTS